VAAVCKHQFEYEAVWYLPPPFVTTIAGEHMPAFCARWPDGSFSIVDADDETHALIQLDQLGMSQPNYGSCSRAYWTSS
jgi:hypothetical protein